VSVENELYLHFVSSVVAPLKAAVETGEVKPEDALEAVGKMTALNADFAIFLKDGIKDVNSRSTPRMALPVNGTSDAVATPLDKWLSEVRQLNPRHRSVAREIEILRLLAESNRPLVLKQLHEHLVALGLSEAAGLPAVVTQISRLKKVELVRSEAQGLYSGTDAGGEWLRKRRRDYGSLFVPENVRDTAGR
jgi:hypothetical protein